MTLKSLIAGHGRLEAARSLGMPSIPAIVIEGLSEAKKRTLMLADNRIAQSAGWDREQLAIELAALPAADGSAGPSVVEPRLTASSAMAG